MKKEGRVCGEWERGLIKGPKKGLTRAEQPAGNTRRGKLESTSYPWSPIRRIERSGYPLSKTVVDRGGGIAA